MYLTIKGIVDKTKMEVYFEKVTDDLLMISVVDKIYNSNVLSYWRLTKLVGIPPLEIGIDCEKQVLMSIVFYIDKDCVREYENITVDKHGGNVLIDTSIFSNMNDFIDVNQNYSVQIYGDKLICHLGNEAEFRHSYSNDRMEVFINLKNEIVGFAICNLSAEEIDMIQRL